jgi:hypothetical protein
MDSEEGGEKIIVKHDIEHKIPLVG